MEQKEKDNGVKREDAVYEKLKEIIYEVVPSSLSDEIEAREITSETSLINDLSFDSVTIMDMFLRVEEEFGDDQNLPFITPEEIQEATNENELKLKSVKDLIIKKVDENKEVK